MVVKTFTQHTRGITHSSTYTALDWCRVYPFISERLKLHLDKYLDYRFIILYYPFANGGKAVLHSKLRQIVATDRKH